MSETTERPPLSNYQSNANYCEGSDYSELIVASEQAQNAIQSEKLLKAYNGQGNYAVR